jgi:hypothetical protein
MTLLWKRGEPLERALERVRGLPVEPTAGRAPRDAMLACFEGLDHWLPRMVREELKELIDDGIIVVEQVILDAVEVSDPWVRDVIDRRWSVGIPLRRAAHAALADLASRGVDLRAVHLHGRDIDKPMTPYFIGFELRYLSTALSCFRDHGGVEWLEVVHPTRRGPLIALWITLRDRSKLVAPAPGFISFFS